MEIETKTAGDDFPLVNHSDSELLKFALQLAAPCHHCSLKASIALMSAKLLCGQEFEESSDARFIEPRWVLCGAVTALEALDEAEAKEQLKSS